MSLVRDMLVEDDQRREHLSYGDLGNSPWGRSNRETGH